MGTPIDQNFLDRLDDLFFAFPPDSYGEQSMEGRLGLLANPIDPAAGENTARSVLTDLSHGIGHPIVPGGPNVMPRSLDDFASMLRVAAGFPAPTTPVNNASIEVFVREFWLAQGVLPNSSLGEYEIILGPNATLQDRVNLFSNLARTAFTHFITNYDYNFNGQDPIAGFFSDWTKFLSVTNLPQTHVVNITPTNILGALAPDPTTFTANNITSYHDMYFAFVPGGTEADFEATFKKFFDDKFNENGYFIASQFVGDWFQEVLKKRLDITFGSTAVDGTNSFKVSIIFKLFALLTDLLGTLQKVAATQAQRLQFYANIQQAYTNLMAKVPTVTVNQISAQTRFATDDADDLSRANQAQQQISSVTQAYTEKLRSYRQVWSDEARSHETSVNQSNETVNQQSNLATALLQQMSSILQGIFR